MEPTEGSETSAFENWTPGRYPKEANLHRFNGFTGGWVGQRGHYKTRGLYFPLWKRKLKSIPNRVFILYRIVAAVKRAEFVSDAMLYIVRRGRCVISVFCFCIH